MPKKTEPAPLKYPPDRKLAALFARAVKLAMQLPGVEETRAYGTPAIKVKGKFLARLRSEAEGGLAIRCSFNERDILLMAAPEVFYITDHYANHPAILINLAGVDWAAMPAIIENAWRIAAPPALVKKYDADKPLINR